MYEDGVGMRDTIHRLSTRNQKTMPEDLATQKRVRGGQRTALTKTLQQVEAALSGDLNVARLTALKMALAEKLKMLSQLDDEIAIFLTNEDELAGISSRLTSINREPTLPLYLLKRQSPRFRPPDPPIDPAIATTFYQLTLLQE